MYALRVGSEAPLTQISIQDKVCTEVLPLAALTDDSPLEFFILWDSSFYLDLSDVLLLLRVKIMNANGTNLVNDAPTTPINYLLNTMFQVPFTRALLLDPWLKMSTVSSVANLGVVGERTERGRGFS